MTSFVVRDKRANKRFFIDNAILRGGWGRIIGPYGLAVYSALALHADVEKQCAWPSHQLLAELTGMSRPSVIKALNQLEELGMIGVERRKNRPHIYHLTDQSQWALVNAVDTVGVNDVYTDGAGVNDVDSGVNVVDTTGVNVVDTGVNDVDSGVNDVYTNNTHITKPTEQDPNEQDPCMAADAAAHVQEADCDLQESDSEKPLNCQMFEALAVTCAWEIELITEKQRGQLNQTEKRLRTLRGQTVTPADVLAFGQWWRGHDWRGKQGEHPRPDQIRAEWGRFRYWQNQQAEVIAARQEAEEYAERARVAERRADDGPPELVAAKRLWEDALAELGLSMDRAGLAWFKGTRAIGRENGRLRVEVENAASKDWLENRLAKRISEAIKCASGGAVGEVEFVALSRDSTIV